MLRNEWKFSQSGAALADAAAARLSHHQSRLAIWRTKRDEVLAIIRAEGIQVDEALVMDYSNPKSRDWENATRVQVREDLRRDLQECLKKLSFHTERVSEFSSWQQVLSANAAAELSLDSGDWMFFFGQSGQAPSN